VPVLDIEGLPESRPQASYALSLMNANQFNECGEGCFRPTIAPGKGEGEDRGKGQQPDASLWQRAFAPNLSNTKTDSSTTIIGNWHQDCSNDLASWQRGPKSPLQKPSPKCISFWRRQQTFRDRQGGQEAFGHGHDSALHTGRRPTETTHQPLGGPGA
jgi:hypothetical protein